MKILFVVSIALVAALANAGTLYKIVNSDGSVTYTDSPQAGAVEVNMEHSNSAVMPSLSANSNAAQKRLAKAQPSYQLSISSPSDQETIRNNLGKVSVTAKISPIGNGKFQLYLDGTLAQTSPAPSFQLQDVDRGEHSIQVKFVSHKGKILASSQSIVFFLHQASILINSN
ncbi:DUF4124 domain-containing protein [Aliiglaciecola sp. LCG003]|uniref:DUF4124 domain-containing protein n=1 Tax=Aliiglaciecola sp. LCG003 TaxID=3053655 RepID=UPI00257395B6|nr:DUF4124 domain-containing protein [Aliiglaciecola sp. LCG003]WJG08927.1 DUF4124 domain-containing protein [Aliiglaciecola sp. LCG003]